MTKEKKEKKDLVALESRLNVSRASPMDVYIGSRLRLRRTLLGISQDQLADEMNLTFQQIQKYEKGINRISSGRLWEMARLLGVSVYYFYENLERTMENLNLELKYPIITGLADSSDDCFLDDDDQFELIKYYAKIKDQTIKKTVLNLVKSLAGESEGNMSETLPITGDEIFDKDI